MKKKKGKFKNMKCDICLHMYDPQHLDDHMHSRSHHEAIARLSDGDQIHKCWACNVRVSSLEQFRKHIQTKEHVSMLSSLKKRRRSGIMVYYNDEKLNALCAEREQKRLLLKKQRKQQRLKERKASKLQEAFNQNSHTPDKNWSMCEGVGAPGSQGGKSKWRDAKSFQFPLNHKTTWGKMDAGHVLESVNDEGCQALGWNSFSCRTSTWSMKKDVDFSKDQFFSSWEEEKSQQNQYPSRDSSDIVWDQKTSRDAQTSSSPPLKKQSLQEVPSMKPRSSPSVWKSDCVGQSTSAAAAQLQVPGLVQNQVDHISIMLKNIRKSLDDDVGSSENPGLHLRSVVSGNGLNEPGNETSLSDVPEKCPQKSSTQRHKCLTQACKTRSPSFPPKHQNNVDLQEKPEPTTTRKVLPTLLSRSVGKTEANKPNLKVARGIRTSRKASQAAESRVLKPALQKLITCKSSEWRVNWKEIQQEATNRKLQREKGMPRFGIELVNPLPPDPRELLPEHLMHLDLDEGFQWASIEPDTVPLPPSAVPSSKDDACRFPPAEDYPTGPSTSTINHTSCPAEQKRAEVRENRSTSGMSRAPEFVVDRLENCKVNNDSRSETRALVKLENITPLESCGKTEDYREEPIQDNAEHNTVQSIPVIQIKQEKQNFPSSDMINKNPPKRQVNDLLVLSLRENKLCSSLEEVDTQLLCAQAALEATFLEVQRLQMVKQQVTAEMSSLRSKRIDILKRMKNSRPNQRCDADSPGSDS